MAGRNVTPIDRPMIERLGAESLDQQQSVEALLVAVTTSPAFLTRSAEELP